MPALHSRHLAQLANLTHTVVIVRTSGVGYQATCGLPCGAHARRLTFVEVREWALAHGATEETLILPNPVVA